MPEDNIIIIVIGIFAVLAFAFSIIDTTEMPYLNVDELEAGSITADTITGNNLSVSQINVTGLTMDSFTLTTPVEEDLRMSADVLAVRGVSNVPEWVTFIGSTQALAFDKTTLEQVFASFQIPHAHCPKAPLEVHFHTTTLTALNGTGVFCLDYTCANITAIFPATSTTCATVNITDTAFKHWYSITESDMPDLSKSAMCLARIYRNASDIRDTYNNDILLTEFDIHYHPCRLGYNT